MTVRTLPLDHPGGRGEGVGAKSKLKIVSTWLHSGWVNFLKMYQGLKIGHFGGLGARTPKMAGFPTNLKNLNHAKVQPR